MNEADKQRIAQNVAVCRRTESLTLAVQFSNVRPQGTTPGDVINVAEVFRNYIENGSKQ
ncbi:hypothetical protein [Mycolicibacterium sp.]|uniref:hypothetical protein n=1 Tax=Mycolicibacterium sp. TaxID=2320850 RepID=UPI0037C6CC71